MNNTTKLVKDSVTNYTIRFDKWADFIEAASKGQPNVKSDRLSRTIGNAAWSGTYDYEEAVRFLNKGWKSGIKELEDYKKEIPPDLYDGVMPVFDYKPELRHKISGGILDVAAHLSGATPEVFVSEVTNVEEQDDQNKVKGNKLKSVYINVCNNAFESRDAFFYRGALSYYMVEHLEECGYSCEVWAVIPTEKTERGKATTSTIYVKVKEFGELLDNNKLAIALSSMFMLRRFGFSIMEQQDDYYIEQITNEAYGSTRCNAPLHEIVLPEDMDLDPLWISTSGVSEKGAMMKAFQKILGDYLNGGVVAE